MLKNGEIIRFPITNIDKTDEKQWTTDNKTIGRKA